jgi:hypothetical protein
MLCGSAAVNSTLDNPGHLHALSSSLGHHSADQ